MTTKTINGRIYTHQTQENPPRYARELGDINSKHIDMREVWALKNNEDDYELCVKYSEKGTYHERRSDELDLVPIPAESEEEYWSKFEHIVLDAWYREKGKALARKIEEFNTNPSGHLLFRIDGCWASYGCFKNKEYSLDGKTWHACKVVK